MRYVCVHCDHTWEAPADAPPRRCPACMRANGPQPAITEQPASAAKPRSRAALIGLAAVCILAAVGGYFAWGARPTAGERGTLAPLSATELRDSLDAQQIDAGDLSALLVADDTITRFAEKAAANAASGPYAKAEAIQQAVRAQASALAFVPWSLGEPRTTPIGTAQQTLLKLAASKARSELYPLELVALEVAALRALDVPALVAELINVEGERAPLDPSGYLGYFVVAVYDGEPGLGTPRLFDPYGGRPLAQGGKHAVLHDTQAIGAALATRALHEISYLADPKKALDSSSHALILAGGLPSVRTVRGMVVLAGRLAEQGFQELEAARQQRDDAPRKHNLASAALMTGDLERATKELTGALERTPDFAGAHATQATLALMKGDAEQARSELALADKLAPDLSLVQWARAELALRDGDSQQALVIAEKAMAARPSFDARLRMGMLLRQLGKRDDLRKLADSLLAMAPAERTTEVRSVITSVLGPAALGEDEPAEAPPGTDPSAAPTKNPDEDATRDPPPQHGGDDEHDGTARRKGKQLRLGDSDQQLKLKLDP